MSEEQQQWLTTRRKVIGGSDAAPICGVSPWRTAYQVWEQKLGLADYVEPSPAMKYGLLVEPALRQWYSDETGLAVRLPKEVIVSDRYPFMGASLDGFTDNKRVIEIKTARSMQDWGEPGTDEIPVYYRLQVEHYFIVTGFVVADVVVSFAGSMPVIYEVEADKELQEMMIEKEAAFWKLVEYKIPPETVTYADVVSRFKRASVGQVVATEEVIHAVQNLSSIRADLKALAEEEEKYKAIVMKHLGEYDILTDIEGKVLATWRQSIDTTRFDADAFKTAHADLYRKFQKPVAGSRRFLLK